MNVNELFEKPCYVFTSDLDWACEDMIRVAVEAHRGVPLTPFITHESATIGDAYQGKHIGVHPNFRVGSTHGEKVKEVIAEMRRLSPSNFYRCHGFYEDSNVSVAMRENGYRFDSNLALHLQNYVIPLRHQSGSIRFPMTLEDDYLLRESGLDWEKVRSHLAAPGLKVFNFHPVHIALNTPSLEYYNEAKRGITTLNWREYIHEGDGIAQMLVRIRDYVRDSPGLGAYYLDDLYSMLYEDKPRDAEYRRMSEAQRVNSVRSRYNQLDAGDIYATSRDKNLRELEIDYILSQLKDNYTILDLGCGNGYTDIRVAKAYKSKVLGLDLSENMISGAKKLAELSAPLRGSVEFRVQDCRRVPLESASFDAVITERFMLNLPDAATQGVVLREIHRVLKPGGLYIMVEGSLDGLENLNKMREKVGLKAIPNRSEDNLSAIKFRESDLEATLAPLFRVRDKRRWGAYYLISRVVHPLLVAPEEPRYAAPINAVARAVQSAMNGGATPPIGHVVGYTLIKRRTPWRG